MYRIIAAIILVLFTSSCSYFTEEEFRNFSCPEIGFVDKTDTINIHDIDIVINGISSECSPLDEEKHVLDISVSLPFKSQNRLYKGTDLEGIKVYYFIAIVGPNEELLQRQVFSTVLEFNELGEGNSIEDHRIDLPVTDLEEAYKYKIAVGFINKQD